MYTDGASRSNPGHSASGFMIYEDDKLLHKHFEYNGVSTNNYSEYKAVLLAFMWCLGLKDSDMLHIKLYSDNELVIRQLSGKYKMKSEALKPLNSEIAALMDRFKHVELMNVRRENAYISAVDRALNELLDKRLKNSKKI
ncbi:MAG: ribonuclease HI family protein [Candidatus Micrarchaeaceae archaeon]